jgi:hypothetical protein
MHVYNSLSIVLCMFDGYVSAEAAVVQYQLQNNVRSCLMAVDSILELLFDIAYLRYRSINNLVISCPVHHLFSKAHLIIRRKEKPDHLADEWL